MKKGSKMSDESINKIKLSKTGRKMSPRTIEHKRNISTAKLGIKNPMFGKKHSTISKDKIRNTMKVVVPKGKNHHLWKGGFYDREETNIRHSSEYKNWRKAVYERDKYTCQTCSSAGGNLQADHIKSLAYYPELRFDIRNGRTLCLECHKKTNTYGARVHKSRDN